VDNALFTGRIISVKTRIRLFRLFIRSFNRVPTHQYQGYTLILDGDVDGVMRNRFNVGTGPKTHEQDQFRIGDSVRAHATPIPKPETEWAGSYRVLYPNSPNERTLAIGRLVRTAASRRCESDTVHREISD
jgi:hypothetical protein